ncbi:MAG: stage III sporulation protein AB [Lachnospiraceae bacterium]
MEGMMFLKIAGMILILASTSSMGFMAGMDAQKHLDELLYIRQFLRLMGGEIKCRKQPLAETFSHMSSHLREPYRQWILQLSKSLLARECISFSEMWDKSVRKELADIRLTKKEKDGFAAFGGQIGYLDTEMQLGMIDLYLEQLERDADKIRRELFAKKRLYHCLGIMSGVFLCVLFV